MAGGRPLKFQSVEELQKAIDAYFAECIDQNEPFTITGLALALDTTRHTLIHYEQKEEFLHTLKAAKTRVENYAEKRLFSQAATGAIFALKNYGWSDKVETDNTHKTIDAAGNPTGINAKLSQAELEKQLAEYGITAIYPAD